MKYYKTNAVYGLLTSARERSLVWVCGNAWLLIYGDSVGLPKALVLAFGTSWERQRAVIRTASKIARRSGLPLIFVQFDDSAATIDRLQFCRLGQQPCELTLEQLKDEFQKYGLPVQTGACGKSVNDATSSAYHNWQRNSLGAIKVTDLDLVRLNSEGDPVEAIELKRSIYALHDWNPYPDDFVNFNLLLALCKLADMKMTIAYNHRQKKPVLKDDASRLALFSYAAPSAPVRTGTFSFNDFLQGAY